MTDTLEREFVPDWDTIQSAWEPCMDHLAQCGVDPDAAYSLCMVVLELLENGVKYGAFRSQKDRIRLRITVRPDTFTAIEVSTPVDADDSLHLRRLDAMVQWIRGFQNPFEAYVERLKQVAASQQGMNESGLGLVRIAYEGQCILDFIVDEESQLSMSAVYQARRTSRARGNVFVERRSVANAE